MGNFFHGWKRKLGIFTLVMACAFSAECLRSFRQSNIVCLRTGIHWQDVFGSLDGQLIVGYTYSPFGDLNQGNKFVTLFPPEMSAEWLEELDRVWSCCGFSNYESPVPKLVFPSFEPTAARVWIIPYWSIVIPLSLISTWLLLSKARESAHATTVEPIPIEVK